MFLDWIRHSIEWTQWGEMVMRVSTVGTIFFTLFAMWSVVKQDQTIRKNLSGESVSVPMFLYIMSLYFAFGYYGWTRASVSMIFNGALGFFYLAVVLSLWKYKGFTRMEKRLALIFPLLVLLMVVVSWKETLMTLILFGSLVFMSNQPYEIYKSRKAGSVDIRYIGVFFTSTLFWTVFAFKTHTVPLMVVNPFVFLIMGSTILLWYKYRERPLAGARAHS